MFNCGGGAGAWADRVRHESVVKRDGRGNGNEGYRNGRGYRDGKDTDKYRSAAGGGGDAGKTKAALDEFIKIKTGHADSSEISQAYANLIARIRQDNAEVAVANVPKIDQSKMGLAIPYRWRAQLDSVYYKGEEAAELYPTAVRGDGERVYFVFDVEDGVRYYLFYDNSVNGMYSSLGYPLLVGKAHTRAEFETLKKGDPISKVEGIDSITRYYGKRGMTVHYLRDGLAFIEYTRTDDNEELIIDSIKIIEGHKYSVKEPYREVEVNCEINPLDLPQ